MFMHEPIFFSGYGAHARPSILLQDSLRDISNTDASGACFYPVISGIQA